MPKNSYPIGSLWIAHDEHRSKTYVFRVVGRVNSSNPNRKVCEVHEIIWNVNEKIREPFQNTYSHKHLLSKFIRVDFDLEGTLAKLKDYQSQKQSATSRITTLGIPFNENDPEWKSRAEAEQGFYVTIQFLRDLEKVEA